MFEIAYSTTSHCKGHFNQFFLHAEVHHTYGQNPLRESRLISPKQLKETIILKMVSQKVKSLLKFGQDAF